jgi:predicted metal-dependent hydrolase
MTSVTTIVVAGSTVLIVRKPIRHLYLRLAPDGERIIVSAPWSWPDDRIAQAITQRRAWIEQQRRRRAIQHVRVAGELDGLPIPIWGQMHRIRILAARSRPTVVSTPGELVLHVGAEATLQHAHAVLAAWQRATVRAAAHPVLAHWCQVMGLSISRLTIRPMTTLWGSCQIRDRRICLNARLVHDPAVCLEYVIVHELTHLIEQSHGPRFDALVGHWLPDWRERHALLGRNGG